MSTTTKRPRACDGDEYYCKQHKMPVRRFRAVSLMGARIVLCKVRKRYPYAKLFTAAGIEITKGARL